MRPRFYEAKLKIFESIRDLPAHLGTRNQWKRRRRVVKNRQIPVAYLQWSTPWLKHSETLHPNGTTTITNERTEKLQFAPLYAETQTRPYKGSLKGWATEIYYAYFVKFSSRQHHLLWWDKGNRWSSLNGPLLRDKVRNHINQKEKCGVRGGKKTWFGAIDLDLHNGNSEIFLQQFQVLLDEFHGTENWHFEVANQNAGGVHLIQVLRTPKLLDEYRAELRKRLEVLDAKHPELADKARAAGMKTIAELEIFPDRQKGFRLPLCEGRTMLLHQPLQLMYSKRMKRWVQDVHGYVSWLAREEKPYMPLEDVFQFVQQRLRVNEVRKQTPKGTSRRTKVKEEPGERGSLGKMKNRYAQVLVDFWSGKENPADTLNTGIRLLALTLPYYLSEEEEAVELIERYIDELPDVDFSDRLVAGNRSEVSRIIRNTVHQAYHGNSGQPEPELSTAKLEKTVAAWRRRGFSPIDKSTWKKVDGASIQLAKDFSFTGQEIVKMSQLQDILNVDLETTVETVRYFLRMVKGHAGEIAVTWVRHILEKFGIKCGHNGKAGIFVNLLREWGWIYMKTAERWHERDEQGNQRPGRARSYGVGEEMAQKFEGETGYRFEEGQARKGCPERKREEVEPIITSHLFVDWTPERLENAISPLQIETNRNKGSPCVSVR